MDNSLKKLHLQNRIAKLSLNFMKNKNLIRKANRELRKLSVTE